MLSARSDENQKIAALDAGADNYLGKPFGLGELLARVCAAARRRTMASSADARVVFGDIDVDLEREQCERPARWSISHRPNIDY